MDKKNADFTQGNILKKLLWFMVPILGALVLQAAYGAVDLLVVGRFGSTSGLSAVSTGSQILNLVTFVVTQLAMGITVLIARYLGEKKPQQIGPVLGGAILIFSLISVGLCVVLVCFAHSISVLMQAPTESLDLTVSYVRICGSGIFFRRRCSRRGCGRCAIRPWRWRPRRCPRRSRSQRRRIPSRYSPDVR